MWFCGGCSTGEKLGEHSKNIEPCAHRATTPPMQPFGFLPALEPQEGSGYIATLIAPPLGNTKRQGLRSSFDFSSGFVDPLWQELCGRV